MLRPFPRSRPYRHFLPAALALALVSVGGITGLTASHLSARIPKTIASGKSDQPKQRRSVSPAVAWINAASLNTARFQHTATLLPNGKVLVAGGLGDTGGPRASAELYDPLANTWTNTGSLTAARYAHTATLLNNGKVLVAGGSGVGGGLGSAELYDPATGLWTSGGTLTTPRESHTATLLTNGKVLVAGGGFFLASAELYDPTANTWASTGPLSIARREHAATLLSNGQALVSGGVGNVGNFLTSAERFNPATNTWSSAGNLAVGRSGHATTLLQDGRVLAAGGFGGNSFDNLASAELYNQGTNTWSNTGSLHATHSQLTATLLPNGKVLAAAGSGTGSATAELFDPASNTWSDTAVLNDDRFSHTATLLNSGKVLVAGGEGNNNTLGSAELYDPLAVGNGGRKIVFGSVRNGGNHDIYAMDLDGGNQIRLTNNPAYDDQPKWSPDGTKIAFMSDRDGNFEIYSMNADGSNQARLTNNPAADGFPAWSPDGTKIAFVRGDIHNASTFEIYVMNADGTNQTRLTNDSLIDGVPAWSPDGTKIVFMSGATGFLDLNSFEIYVMNADGSNRTRLTNNTVGDGQPSYSPDGTKILFSSGDAFSPTGIEIFVMNANGTNRTRLTNNAVTDGFPVWSPDGTKILFASGSVADETTVELFVMNADGSNPTKLTNNQLLDWFADWQPGAVFSISGQVKDVNGAGLGGITVTLSGSGTASTTTSNSGAFSFPNLVPGSNFTVTPSSANFSFSPASQTFNSLSVNRIANFVATQSVVSISGKVTDGNNVGIGAMVINLTKNGVAAGTVPTDGLGNYNFGNLAVGANYVVTAVGAFTPSSQTFGNLTTNATANFKAAPSVPPQCNTPSFAAQTNFAVGAGPYSLVAGDFNGDGKMDLAATNQSANSVSILLATGTGSFSAATNFAVGSVPLGLAVGDFNGDGQLDLAVANGNSNNVSILLGTGTGSFGAPTNFIAGGGPRSVAVSDFNGDGKQDLAVTNDNSNDVSILLGTGSGSFGAPTNFATGSEPRSVAVSDLNGDGKLDLAVANRGSSNISILLGTGAGSFGAATNFVVTQFPISVAVGDFNGDGKPDLAVRNDTFSGGGTNVSIFLGTGTGSFGAATTFPVGPSSLSFVTVGDFNGDGKLDLLVPNQGNTGHAVVSVLLGTGTGSFSGAIPFGSLSIAQSAIAADFNGDGKLDLAALDTGFNNVSVLLNNGAICNTQTSISISGQLTDAGNNPLPNITVTLTGPISRVTSTNASGNYSFPNLVPGGNYAVTVQTPYFVVAPSRVDFFNLSSSQVANFIAAPVAVPSPTPPLVDDFTSTVRDATKWTIGTQTSPPASFDPQVTTVQVNGQLVITPLTQASGLHYDGYVSVNSFDMRNGSVGVQLVKAATGGADSIFAIGTDSDNFFRFLVHTAGGPTSLAPTAKGRDGIERPLDTTVAQLVFQVKVNGVLTSVSIPYDPVQQKFLRFRNDPPTNSIVFETSPNFDYSPISFQQSVVLQKSVSALTVELSAGTPSPVNPGQTIFDDLNLVTSTFQFSVASYAAGEGDGSVLITVTRVGSTTAAATVDYATADGTAVQGSKYIPAAGTLTFAPGQTSNTFNVQIVDNAVAEGNETVNLLLRNPTGPGLNAPGRAVLTIADNDTTVAKSIQFSSAGFTVSEGSPRVDITLTRSGDTTSSASVSFATNDAAGLTNCNVINHIASPRCDYINTGGTLTWAAGDATSKSFSIAIVDDGYAEGNETFTVSLNSPAGATLGTQSIATVTITDNEAVNGANPIDNTNFFVRQQYIDFLGREPDPPGFAGWTSTINNCTGDTTQCDRIHVSQLFFQSEEFQSRGYFVYRFYPVAFGRKPDYAEFVPDLARVSGFLDATQLEAAKVQFITDFMARAAFASAYNSPNTPTGNQQYVDALLGTAGVTLASRQTMINGLNNSTLTRGQVLRQIVESPEVSTKYNHQAYAVMEYFGYLRRQPDAFYLDWIAVLDQSNDPRGMVTGFATSVEYRNRFGP